MKSGSTSATEESGAEDEMNGWLKKIGSAVVALIGALMMVKGFTPETTWAEFPGLIGPWQLCGGGLIVWRSMAGKEQMKLPGFKKKKSRYGA